MGKHGEEEPRRSARRGGKGADEAPRREGASGSDAAAPLAAHGEHHNEVRLTGRVSGAAQKRELPSGAAVVQLRLVVHRPSAPIEPTAGSSSVSVDTIDLACWSEPLRAAALSLEAGEVISVESALRRRFWRSPAGLASRYEVEVLALQRQAPQDDLDRPEGARSSPVITAESLVS